MERYGTHCEQTYRTNFNRSRAKCIDWVKFNLALCRRYLNMDGLLAIAIDPSYISKSGKKTPHIGTFWSGCANSMKHGLEIMGLALVDVYALHDAARPSDSIYRRVETARHDSRATLHSGHQAL